MKPGYTHNAVVRVAMVGAVVILAVIPLVVVLSVLSQSAQADSASSENVLVTPVAISSPTTSTLPALPDWIERFLQQEKSGYAPSADVLVVISAQTGTDDPTGVYLGENVTYTISMTNLSAVALDQVLLVDLLPRDALDDITCDPDCELIYEERQVPEPSGGTIVVRATRQVSWTLPALGAGNTVTRSFAGKLTGQSEGAVFTDRAFVSYLINGDTKAAGSDPLDLTAHVRILAGGGISSEPTWYSKDMGGTISQDWGDYDRDGNMDLALGSSVGATVYRNDGKQLSLVWTSPSDDQGQPRPAYGVRWAEIFPNPQHWLDLVVVGESVDHSATSQGLNYIYSYDSARDTFVQTAVFTSDYQLVRVVANDFDGDGNIDLIASTNAINVPCPLILYRNDGTGHFIGTLASGITSTQSLTGTASGLHNFECLSQNATAAIAVGDYDNDGDPDLAAGAFPNSLRVLVNGSNGSPITNSNPLSISVPVETDLEYVPYDLAWGDYNQDGYLELAAAYPLQREARIYAHSTITALALITQSIRTAPFMTPMSIDWGDVNGDGQLELIVADSPPAIYQYYPFTQTFEVIKSLALPASLGQVWSIRGADLNAHNNLDVAMTNRDGPSRLFSAFAPKLKPVLTNVGNQKASSVAWGDANGDGSLDLLFGAAPPPNLSSFLYINENGSFTTTTPSEFPSTGFGPQYVAFGDFSGDGDLDVAIGTPFLIHIYQDANTTTPFWSVPTDSPVRSLAACDFNDDGWLDLAVGHEDGLIEAYLSQSARLPTMVAFSDTVAGGSIRSLACGDFDGDYYLDLAVGIDGRPSRVYRNNGDGSFSVAWTSPYTLSTRAVAWADYNQDGSLDLAMGNYGAEIQIWDNVVISGSAHTLGVTPAWTSTTSLSKTTSLAWGDWDNDGYPDLAVGKDGEPVAVYANFDSSAGSPQLFELWHSNDSYATTGLAWGDRDGDGDLDLAVSRSGGQSGYFENTSVAPAHLPNAATWARPLPNNPPYAYVARPGRTADAYLYSSPEILAESGNPTVTIEYLLYDPEGVPISTTFFEYSLDGGSQWFPATPDASSPAPITQTSPTGVLGKFIWNANSDHAVSDNARFRIRVVARDSVGPVQRSSGGGVSPSFRVRGLDCFWPQGISIIGPSNPPPFQEVTFQAQAATGSGQLNAYWTFSDGTTNTGWEITHTFGNSGIFTVTLEVDGPACPIARPGFARRVVAVGNGVPFKQIFLPLIMNAYSPTTSLDAGYTMTAGLPIIGYSLAEMQHHTSAQAAGVPTRLRLHVPVTAQTDSAPRGARSQGDLPPLLQGAKSVTRPTGSAGGNQVPSASGTSIGRQPVRVAGGGVNSRPTANYTGTQVAFWSTGDYDGQNSDGNIEVFLAELQSQDQISYTQITSSAGSVLGGFNLAPSIDDSGDHVAFFSDLDLTGRNPDRNFEIYMASYVSVTELISGTGGLTTTLQQLTVTQVTQTPKGVNILPAISGDGKSIAFASDVLTVTGKQSFGQAEIFRARVESVDALTPTWNISFTRITTVTTQAPGVSDQPAINGDGQAIAFVSNQSFGPPPNSNPDHNREIYLAQIGADDTISYTQITSSTDCISELPSISADGRRVAFVSDCDLVSGSNSNHIREVFFADVPPDLAPGTSVPITQVVISTSGDKDQPRISADGTRIAFITSDDRKLHVFDLIDGKEAFGNPGSSNAYPSLSPNGTTVAFVANWAIYLANYPLADLGLLKSADRTMVANGQQMTYTLVVFNNGPSSATAVVLTDTLPLSVQVRPLTAPDYTDNSQATFHSEGYQPQGVDWDTNALTLITTTNVFELPGSDKSLMNAWMDRTGNVLLLHLNEASGPTFTDASGSGNNGGCTGTTCPTSSAGKLNKAFQFDGTSQFITVPTSPSLSLSRFTVGAWVKPTQVKPDWQPLITKEDSSGQWRNYGLFISPNSMNVHFSFRAGYWIYPCSWYNTWRSYTSLGSLAINQWNHVMMTYDGAYFKLYLNGELDSSASVPWYYPPCQNTEPVKLGRELSAYTPFAGALDEAAIFNRALSADEVRNVYQRQMAPKAGYFDSGFMMQTGGIAGWNSVTWLPDRLVGKALPDDGAADAGYPAAKGSVSMADNVLLLHLNEPVGFSNFVDTSGYANNGQCFGSSCPQAGISGREGQALHLDGTNDYVQIQNSDSLNFTATQDFAVELWVKPDAVQPDSNIDRVIVDKWAGQGGFPYLIDYWSDTGQVMAMRGDDANWAFVFSPGSINDGSFHHIAFVKNGLTLTLYIDGQPVASTTDITTGNTANAVPVYLGQLGGNILHFAGSIDEVAIFGRALSAAEVSTHYLRGAMQLQFQARSCTQKSCSTEPFSGPDGTRNTYYTFGDVDQFPPMFGLNVPDKDYFQYRVFMDTYTQTAPQLISVTVSPWANCIGASTITCTIGTQVAPLSPHRYVTVTLPVTVTSAAYQAAVHSGAKAITNTAHVYSNESSDHYPQDNYKSLPTLLAPVPVSQVIITGPIVGQTNSSYEFVADAGIATIPITFTWRASDQAGTTTHVSEYTDTVTFAWTEPGSKVITATAQNSLGSATNTFVIDIEAPVTAITVSSDSPTDLGDSTTLTATANGTNVTYAWNLGDGTIINAGAAVPSVVTHTYNQSGSYTVIVTASNPVSVFSTTTLVTVNQPPLLSITKSGPTSQSAGHLITYTLTVTNDGSSKARNLVITDAVPTNAGYAGSPDGGVLIGGKVVSWTTATLAKNGGSQTYTFAVTATQTITNSDYRVSASGGFSATGSVSVTTAANLVAPTGVSIAPQATTGVTNTTYYFTATVSPLDVSWPITFTWTTTGPSSPASPVTDGPFSTNTDSVGFSWGVTGTYSVTVTAINVVAPISSTQVITIQ